jgi:hypothetical protein
MNISHNLQWKSSKTAQSSSGRTKHNALLSHNFRIRLLGKKSLGHALMTKVDVFETCSLMSCSSGDM